jgi:YVTN family beta-propeller protein
MRGRLPSVLLPAVFLGIVVASPARAWQDTVASAAFAPFPNFESGAVNALLLTPDGRTLLALNTPDHRVEVYSLVLAAGTPGRRGHKATGSAGLAAGVPPLSGGPGGGAGPGQLSPAPGMSYLGAIFTGLEPVAMTLHPDDPNRLYVSNVVSDTVSVVDIAKRQVIGTIEVGDEPQGLVVVGDELFVACARATDVPMVPGQTDPGPSTQHTLVIARASPPYDRLAIVDIGAVKPRDVVEVGGTVYVIPQNSGNRTVIMDETVATNLGLSQDVIDAFDAPFKINPVLQRPEFNSASYARGWYIPTAGRIVFDTEFPGDVHQLLDRDIVGIDATSHALLPDVTTGVATTLLDIEQNPVTGELWVAGTNARNRTRFEPTLSGDAFENVVVIATPGGSVVQTVELAPPFTSRSHAQPAVLAFGSGPAGNLAAVGCLGTASVVVLDANDASLIFELQTGEIPAGLAIDGARGVLYVLSRGDRTLAAYDATRGFARIGPAQPLAYDPEPLSVTIGRSHLYDARADTGHGSDNFSCASCHVFGHEDQLGWDLGNPGGSLAYYYPDVLDGFAGYPGQVMTWPTVSVLNPMKGPMVTQSLRGLMDPGTKDNLPLHWRGDRRTLHMFRGAFQGLLGGSGLTRREMQEFASFVRSMRFPPNPNQPLDREYVGLAATGRDVFGMNPAVQGKEYVPSSGVVCITCHQGDFTNQTDFTGARPTASFGSFTQMFNTAQLRNMYEKDFKFTSGFGSLHDGAVDGVRGFMDFVVPNGGLPTFPNFLIEDKDAVATFVKAWDTGLSPLVGKQFTLTLATLPDADTVLDLFEAEAQPPASNVDLILKGFRYDIDGTLLERGAHFRFDTDAGIWGYQFDTGDFVPRSVLTLLASTGTSTLTFTCVPPGMGERLGIDRDEDGSWDELEVDAGTDPVLPDTDGDGYLDGSEPALGGDPLVPDLALPDLTAPSVLDALALEIFADVATLSFRTDEPSTAVVRIGTTPGVYTLLSVSGPAGLRRVHDVIVEDLPADTDLYFEVTASDRDGNAGLAVGSFRTLPPMLHVADLTLTKSGAGPYTLQATVLVKDHTGAALAGVPVQGFWAGDIGGQAWEQTATTDGSGVATFNLAPFTPAGSTEISFSPAYIGQPQPLLPYFVGVGGGTADFFYDQVSNVEHFLSIDVP